MQLTVHGMLWIAAACWAPITGPLRAATLCSRRCRCFIPTRLNLSVLGVLATGASEYIMEKFSTSEAVRLLKTGEFTYFPGVPTMFHYLLQATRAEKDVQFPEPAALRVGRRHHAGDAQPRIRERISAFRCSTATASPKPRPW